MCFYCSIGRPDQCSETFDRNGIWPHVADRHNGEPVSAAGNVGGYAEVMNVTATQVFPVATDLPDQWLSLLGCGITTGLGSGVQQPRSRRGRAWPSSDAGTSACGWCRARLANAHDHRPRPDRRRRELAGTLGATHTVDPSAEDPLAAVQALTGGRGADYVLEAATLASAQTQKRCCCRRAGRVVLTSIERGDATVTFPQVALAVQSREIISAQNGRVRMRHDLPRFIRMMEDGLVTPEPIITSTYKLDQINDAEASMEKRDSRA